MKRLEVCNHQRYRLIFIVALLIVRLNSLHSQEKEKLFEVSAGASLIKIKDNSFSTITYKGLPFCASFGYAVETATYKDDVTISFQHGKLEPSNGNMLKDTETRFTGANIVWEHSRKLGKQSTSTYHLYLGGIFNSSFIHYKRNYYGDDSYYLYQSSLGPLFRCTYAFAFIHKKVLFDNQLNFSLFTYAVNPSYSSPLPERLLKKDLNEITAKNYITGGKFYSINKFQRIQYQANLKFNMNIKTALQLIYVWEIININRQDLLTMAHHDFALSILFKV